jgi:hypothetical protein
MEEIKVGDRVASQVVDTNTQSFTYRLGRVIESSKAESNEKQALTFYVVRFDDGEKCALTACSLLKVKNS